MQNKLSNRSTISIVIPCYNASQYLKQTISSALDQSQPPHEILVVDDGSTDDSVAIARSFGDPVKVVVQRNQGAHVARRNGVQAAVTDYVAFQDADDTVSHTRIEDLSTALTQNPECVAAIGMTSNEINSTRTPPDSLELADDGSVVLIPDTLDWMLNYGAPIAGAMNLLTRRSIALAAFRAGRGLPAANDYDLQLHLAARGDFVVKCAVSCHYMPGESGITSQAYNALQPTMAICAAVEALQFSKNPLTQKTVLRRLSEIGPMFVAPLMAAGEFRAAAKLIILLTRYGSWSTIPRRIWWGIQRMGSQANTEEGPLFSSRNTRVK